MRLAVVIPSYHRHIPFLPRLLESINKQTRLPDLVVVRISSCGLEEIPLLQKLREIDLSFLLVIHETEKLQMAAQNRNEGVELVPPGFDIISFFDSDDIMHPRRIELLERCFQEYPSADLILHSGQSGPLTQEEKSIIWEPIEEPLKVHLNKCSLKPQMIAGPFKMVPFKLERVVFEKEVSGQLNGHCSIRRHCFEKVQFVEDAYGYEDSLFVSELYKLGCGILAMDAQLMYYSHCGLELICEKYIDFVTGFGEHTGIDPSPNLNELKRKIDFLRGEMESTIDKESRLKQIRAEMKDVEDTRNTVSYKMAQCSTRVEQTQRLLRELHGNT